MDDTVLQQDIGIAEAVDQHLHEQSVRIEDIQGSLEAIAEAIVGDEDPEQLTDHQQDIVDGFKSLAKDQKGAVYAVADSEALEGFLETTAALAKKAVLAFSEEIPPYFKINAKGLNHYVDMAQKLRGRLLQLRPLLEKREFPYEDVFDYGAYSRFFQVNGKSIGSFSEFQEAMAVQNKATRHVTQAASSYAVVIAEKLLDGLRSLQAAGAGPMDTEKLVALRDSVEFHWTQTWKEADISNQPGQTPQAVLNEFPDRKFISIAALMDNRYLLAHEPKQNGGDNPLKVTSAIRHYGASVVFDKKTEKPTQHSMNVPNVDDLLKMVDEVIRGLNDLRAFEVIVKKNNAFAIDFKYAVQALNKRITTVDDPKFYGFVAEYFKLALSVCQAIQQPYLQMTWMYIRCAIVVTSLAELAAIEEPRERIAASRFFTSQSTEFANTAMESFQVTQKALQAAKSVNVT